MELSGSTRLRLASAKRMMKPSTSTAASRSQRLGSRRRASIETGGRIFISGKPRKGVERCDCQKIDSQKPAPIGAFGAAGNHFERPRESVEAAAGHGSIVAAGRVAWVALHRPVGRRFVKRPDIWKYPLENAVFFTDGPAKPLSASRFLYCAGRQIRRKTAAMMGKMVVLPPLRSISDGIAPQTDNSAAERRQVL